MSWSLRKTWCGSAGLIVNSMQDAHHEEDVAATDAYRDDVMAKLDAIEARVDKLK